MLAYAALLLITGVVTIVSAKGVQFMDCPCNEDFWMKSCTSDQLPKGCECYDSSFNSYYINALFHKPHCPEKMNVIFYLYTRDHRTTAQTIKAGEANIKNTSYSGAKKTVFIAHGFSGYANDPLWIDMKNTLLDQEDMNVIIVDWRQRDTYPTYLQAAANTRTVGSMVARLIQDMQTYAQAGFDNFHLIGQSFGAHIMGFAGKEVFRLTNQKVGRISGLNPTGPNFEGYTMFVRIDSTDGQFVDIIHTDGGFGMRGSVGHVDFFPNGGFRQPGCPGQKEEEKSDLCRHIRAAEYFTNSIQRCRYNPPDGNTTCTMGYHVSRSCRGDVRLTTTGTAPYC